MILYTISAGRDYEQIIGEDMINSINCGPVMTGTQEQLDRRLRNEQENAAAVEEELKRLHLDLSTEKSRHAHTEERYKAELALKETS